MEGLVVCGEQEFVHKSRGWYGRVLEERMLYSGIFWGYSMYYEGSWDWWGIFWVSWLCGVDICICFLVNSISLFYLRASLCESQSAMWLLRLFEFSLVESVTGPRCRFTWGQVWIAVHNVICKRKKPTWNPTWQVWIVLAGIAGQFLGMTLAETGRVECAMRILDIQEGLMTSKILWEVHGVLYALIPRSKVPWPFKSHGPLG